MNIVYRLIFEDRQANLKFPYFYVGSKSKCSVENGKILDKKKREYWGSSKYPEYDNIVSENNGKIKCEILFESENYEECLSKENDIHVKLDVVGSPEYFNLRNALQSTYHTPDYGTMRNPQSGKICRVRLDHPEVLAGNWVGATLGRGWYNNGKESKTFFDHEVPDGWAKGRVGGSLRGEKNPNFGKKIPKEQVEKGVATRMKNGSYNAWNKGVKGVTKHSQEAKRKMSLSQKGREAKGKSVKQICPTSKKVVRIWLSAMQASRSLGLTHNHIWYVCKRKRNLSHGYLWEFCDNHSAMRS